MLRTGSELKADFGAQIAEGYGLPAGTKLAAGWSSMKTTRITGIYPLLFNTIVDAAVPRPEDQPSLIERCWEAIAREVGLNSDGLDSLPGQIQRAKQLTRRKLFRGCPALRDDITGALASGNLGQVVEAPEQVTQAGRTRIGLAYFEALHTLVRAAGVQH
jgi:hypothetical protein